MSRPSTLDLLQRYESRNVTFVEADRSWPMVWERAKGVHVWDDTGKRYLDLTAAFGVAAAGHSNPRVVAAGRRQMGRLLHAMGDVHPHRLKGELARVLSQRTFEHWTKAPHPERTRTTHGKTIFCSSGFEAVEAALKTALLATGKAGVIAFEKAYHGVGYGALNATHRAHFRSPFLAQLRQFGTFLPFPAIPPADPARGRRHGDTLDSLEAGLRAHLRKKTIGAILAEPIQVRGGINIPPPGFLPLLRSLCDEHGAVLILDEIYTGFGRTGKWFACEHAGVVPDLVCLGKALTGGFPLSACVGRAELMDAAWPRSTGEAIHTSTFLGHPVGCAMALANLAEIQRRHLVECSAESGRFLLERLASIRGRLSTAPRFQVQARGLGLLAGLELLRPSGEAATDQVLALIKSLLHEGFIFLPEGEHANVVGFTPPLTISAKQLELAVSALARKLAQA
ncbi:MAG TPA: aspartate aminotransferase family protein [Verrucomicrobiae bacterium]|nr:aspartate aminotransferase family protein [Verrucomicrobiae bacterium]